MSRTLVIEPLYCSQGGIPYNKAHLDAKDAEIERLRQLYAERGEMLRRANGQVLRLELEIERLNDALTDYHRVKELGRADAAENRQLRALVGDALRGLHNDFEPDNQSALYKRIAAALKDTKP